MLEAQFDNKLKRSDPSKMDYESTKDELLKNDHEFQQLFREHQECEGRLEELENSDLGAVAVETQAKPIKLHKLALKDRMEALIRDNASP